MKPEEELLVAVCKQAADDYLTAFDELGIAMLKGKNNVKEINKWNNLFNDARGFFLSGGCSELVGANDAQILAGLEAKTSVPRNWQKFATWNEAFACWMSSGESKSDNRKTTMKQFHAWLVRKDHK